ncbi:MAG: hypothetical protein EP328_00025 [Gammaproteobacteria bacterium]|nr:MAG: hypothetical protein EP328_00025 [Gammaproteobacteria bacterium]
MTEAAATPQTEEEVSAFDISDEEWLNSSAALLAPPEVTEGEVPETPETTQEEVTSEVAVPEPGEDPAAGQGQAEGAGDAAEGGEAEVPEQGSETKQPPEKPEEAEAVDYKAAYEKLTAPFRANGKDMQVNNVDDAIQLMMMGANYNKKMAAMKPALKSMKLLERHGLLDDEKLNFLIDINNKNPAAIAKLVKDAGIDPMDLDVDKTSDYQVPREAVDDRELALDEVVDSLRDSPTFDATLKVVSEEWDNASKQHVANNPGLLTIINDHMASGVYEVIRETVDRERMLGRLNGLSDLEAYRVTGDSIQARGGFNHLFQKEQSQTAPEAKAVPSSRPTADPKTKEKRKAAAPSQQTVVSKQPPDTLSPLSLSDEEFERQFDPKFL